MPADYKKTLTDLVDEMYARPPPMGWRPDRAGFDAVLDGEIRANTDFEEDFVQYFTTQ